MSEIRLLAAAGDDTVGSRVLQPYAKFCSTGRSWSWWDVIVDYVARDDTLVFSASGFGGGLAKGQDLVPGVTFISGPTPVAPTTAGTFLYDTDAQDLFWDEDGSDAGATVKIAHFNNPVALRPNDFDIVA